MKRFMTKKVAAIGITAGLILGASGAAFAYFTSQGAGTGTASTGTTHDLTIAQDTTISGLTPNSTPVSIPFTVTNGAAGAGTENVHSVTVSVPFDATSGDVLDATDNHVITGCEQAWFSIAHGTQTLDKEIAGGGNYDFTVVAGNQATVQLTDVNATQDACKSANVALAFSSN